MILVTGGTGLVGAHMLYTLLKKGEQVKAIRRDADSSKKTLRTFSYYTENPDELFEKIQWCTGDVTDIVSLIDAAEGVDEIFHCAGAVNFDPADFKKVMAVNYHGTANVVDVCLKLGIKKLNHISSVAALGDVPDGHFISEETEWQIKDSNSAYSASKFKAEMEVLRGHAEGLDVCIVNPGVIIGPGDWTSGTCAIFNTIWNGLKFYAPGSLGCVDVRDVVSAMLELRERKIYGERFILVSENISFKDMFTQVADSLGRARPTKKFSKTAGILACYIEKVKSKISGNPPLITRDAIEASFKNSLYSNKKAVEVLGFTFISLDKSINDTSELFIKELLQQENHN